LPASYNWHLVYSDAHQGRLIRRSTRNGSWCAPFQRCETPEQCRAGSRRRNRQLHIRATPDPCSFGSGVGRVCHINRLSTKWSQRMNVQYENLACSAGQLGCPEEFLSAYLAFRKLYLKNHIKPNLIKAFQINLSTEQKQGILDEHTICGIYMGHNFFLDENLPEIPRCFEYFMHGARLGLMYDVETDS
jgi:hypothetical protein